jgi:Protein of unknown function (DUF1573)
MKAHMKHGFQLQLEQTSGHRVPLGLFALILACAALLGVSGCTGLTGAGSLQQKSSSSSSSSVTLAITAQPVNESVVVGQTAAFSVAATGNGTLSYQWKKGGTSIGGATAASYTTPATTNSDNGVLFTVVVTDSTGSVLSNAATLTVNATASTLNSSATSLNFSSVNIGSDGILPVVFTNAGNSNVTISNVTISGAGYSASGVSSGQIVTPGHTATLDVTFAPAGTGPIAGNVTVTSNAANSTASIALSGDGVQPAAHSVTLSWTPSASTVTGYEVFRSTVSGGPYTALNSTPDAATTYADQAVQAAQKYYYVVTSVDSSGVESAYSSEVSALVP